MNVDIISLGCSKNLVDSEALMAQLQSAGIKVQHDPEKPKGEVVVINTCGFIGDAKQESIDTILQFAEAKKKRKIKQLIVMGCLSERYPEELKEAIPEVDKFFGKFSQKAIVEFLGAQYRAENAQKRVVTTPKHYAYVKISEGCNRFCSYCAIPLITGRHTSRSIEDIKVEVEGLVAQGVTEIQVIAQDLSSYGTDLYGRHALAELIEEISKVEGLKWIRLHYAYPSDFPYDILPVINNNPKVCKYLDIALQHISDGMLSKMRRHITKSETLELLGRIRREVPGIHLRTTLITGHPGETEADFAELVEFVKEQRFERLGVFPYSHEEDTYSYKHYVDDVPEEVKQQRADMIMEMQAEISADINNSKVGKVLTVVVDRKEGENYVGRTEFDSPEVDPEVLIKKSGNKEIEVGSYLDVRIIEAEEYDLIAEVL